MISNFLEGGGVEIWEWWLAFLEGVIELRTVEDMGEGGVKKLGKSGDVLYGRPLMSRECTKNEEMFLNQDQEKSRHLMFF